MTEGKTVCPLPYMPSSTLWQGHKNMWRYPVNATITKRSPPKAQKKERGGTNKDSINATYEKKKVREKSRECHNHKPQPFQDTKRKPTNPNKHKSIKRTKSTKISSLFPKRGNHNAKRGFKALLPQANFTLGPDATLNTEIYKNSVRIKAPNSVNASKRKHKNQINHYNKQRRVLMANSTVCQSK